MIGQLGTNKDLETVIMELRLEHTYIHNNTYTQSVWLTFKSLFSKGTMVEAC